MPGADRQIAASRSLKKKNSNECSDSAGKMPLHFLQERRAIAFKFRLPDTCDAQEVIELRRSSLGDASERCVMKNNVRRYAGFLRYALSKAAQGIEQGVVFLAELRLAIRARRLNRIFASREVDLYYTLAA